MFYVQSMAIKALEKARFAAQKWSKRNFTSINSKQTWKDVRTVKPLPAYVLQKRVKNTKHLLDTEQWKENCAQSSPRKQTSACNWKPTRDDQHIGDANLNRKQKKLHKS